jgi:hypothetical protein
MADAKCFSELVNRNDSWIAAPGFKAADILLTEPGKIAKLLLRQPLFEPNPPNVLANQLAHIHAQEKKRLHNLSLPTIVCIDRQPGPVSTALAPRGTTLIPFENRMFGDEIWFIRHFLRSRVG